MKKYCIILITMCLCSSSYSQPVYLFVQDANTKQPIPDVYVNFKNHSKGNFTNKDGLTYLNFESDSVIVHHIAYLPEIILLKNTDDTIKVFLQQYFNQLDEVKVVHFDLIKSIDFVFRNYTKLYIDYSVERECTFKEVVQSNGNYLRLLQMQLKWWSKASHIDLKKETNKYCAISLNNIEFFKNDTVSLNDVSAKGEVFVTKNGLISTLYLNTQLGSLYQFKDGLNYSISGATESTFTVDFKTEWKKFEHADIQLSGSIVFDTNTKAVLDLTIDRIYKNFIKKKYSEKTKKEYEVEQLKASHSIHFYKNKEGKLSVKVARLSGEVVSRFLNKEQKVSVTNHFFVLSEEKQRKATQTNNVDLDKPIYKSIATEIKNSASVLLSKEELEFINAK